MQLGFAASGNDGKGVHDIASLNVAATIGEACKRIKKNDAFDPFQFTVGVMLCQKIPMFGPDSLSDWTCHVLRPLFVEYTDECCIGEPVRPELVQDEVAEDSVFLDFWRRMRKKIDAPWSSSTADPNSWSTRAKRLCVPSAVLSPKGEFDAARAFVMSTMARKITGGSTFVKNVSDIVSMLCNCPPLEAIVVPECCLALVQASLVVDVHTTKMYNAAVGAEGPVGEERKTVDSGVVSFFYGGGRLHCVCGSDDTEAVAFARVQASRCWVLLLCDVLEENFNPFRLWLANSRLTIRADLAQIEPLARPTSLLPQVSQSTEFHDRKLFNRDRSANVCLRRALTIRRGGPGCRISTRVRRVWSWLARVTFHRWIPPGLRSSCATTRTMLATYHNWTTPATWRSFLKLCVGLCTVTPFEVARGCVAPDRGQTVRAQRSGCQWTSRGRICSR